MQATGYVRKLDPLGRIVLPKKLRTLFEIHEKDGLEILIDKEDIILRKSLPMCIFCGSTDNIADFKEKHVCKDCLSTLTAESTPKISA